MDNSSARSFSDVPCGHPQGGGVKWFQGTNEQVLVTKSIVAFEARNIHRNDILNKNNLTVAHRF
jgi:hypothetical protein